MTRWPTVVETRVCSVSNTVVTTATRIMPRASSVSRPASLAGMATSSTSRSRNGEASDTSEDRTMSAPTTASRPR